MSRLNDFDIKIFREEDGSYRAKVENLPGCFSMAETLTELEKNLKEAILSYIKSLRKDLTQHHFNFKKKDLQNA